MTAASGKQGKKKPSSRRALRLSPTWIVWITWIIWLPGSDGNRNLSYYRSKSDPESNGISYLLLHLIELTDGPTPLLLWDESEFIKVRVKKGLVRFLPPDEAHAILSRQRRYEDLYSSPAEAVAEPSRKKVSLGQALSREGGNGRRALSAGGSGGDDVGGAVESNRGTVGSGCSQSH